MVKVRSFEVDVHGLKKTLQQAKKKEKLSLSYISQNLNVKKTTAEHWFRQDNSFSIPDPNIWFELKKMLNITTNVFDDAIVTFEERAGVYEKGNRVYDELGLAPTLTTAAGNEKILIRV